MEGGSDRLSRSNIAKRQQRKSLNPAPASFAEKDLIGPAPFVENHQKQYLSIAMSSPLAHALARLLIRLPFMFNVILLIWVESAILGVAFFFMALFAFPQFTFMAWSLLGLGAAVLNFRLIAITKDLTLDFYMSKDWKRSRRMLLRERKANDPERPDFSRLKRFCVLTLSCNLLVALLTITAILTSAAGDDSLTIATALRHSVIILLLLFPVIFYIGWTWYTMKFILKYEPPQHRG
jgi:hypothetical protein